MPTMDVEDAEDDYGDDVEGGKGKKGLSLSGWMKHSSACTHRVIPTVELVFIFT